MSPRLTHGTFLDDQHPPRNKLMEFEREERLIATARITAQLLRETEGKKTIPEGLFTA